MPNWTQSDYDTFQARRRSPRPHPQPAVRPGAVGPVPRAAENSARFLVRITSYRSRLADRDNLCGKFFVDALRYAGLIGDDDPGRMVGYTILQEKVASKKEEKTLIEVIPL